MKADTLRNGTQHEGFIHTVQNDKAICLTIESKIMCRTVENRLYSLRCGSLVEDCLSF